MNNLISIIGSFFTLDFLIKLVIAAGIFLFFHVFRTLFATIIVKIFNIRIKEKKKLKRVAFYKPLKLFFSVLGLYLAIVSFGLPANLLLFVNKAFRICIIALITKAFADSLNKDSLFIEGFQKKLKSKLDNTIIIFFSKMAKIVVYALGAVIIISELGYDVNGIIAGIGLGGLTIALAAQDAAKNIFGGLIIIIDKPFVVGDWIKTSNLEGTIEDITFRSTRIRTFENSVITVPNNTIANDSIINWSRMYKRRVKLNLQVEYGTSLEKIKAVTEKINEVLINHPEVNKEVCHVRFDEFAQDGLNILVYYFTNTTDYDTYLKVKEDINMRILDILEKENVSLAFKTQTIHLKK